MVNVGGLNLKCIRLRFVLETINYTLLESSNIPLYRKSKDRKCNNHGNRLLNLCKNNNIFIVNGRYKSSTSEDLTFRDTSVIDYYLSTVSAYMKMSIFR